MKKILDRAYEQDEFVKRWLVGLSQRTKENYSKELHGWLVFVGMAPEEQIRKRMRDTASQDLTERLFFEDKFRAYKEYI